jgi:hypothetical protein
VVLTLARKPLIEKGPGSQLDGSLELKIAMDRPNGFAPGGGAEVIGEIGVEMDAETQQPIGTIGEEQAAAQRKTGLAGEKVAGFEGKT